jgi:predicted kinase
LSQKLILTVGAPASGKSTYAKKYAVDNGLVYLSSDEARAKFGSGEHDQSVSAIAFDYVINQMVELLASGKSVIVDATNMYPKARNRFLSKVPNGVEKIAMVFEVPREELIRRDTDRSRTVGEGVIDMMLGKYERPTKEEFDQVIDL